MNEKGETMDDELYSKQLAKWRKEEKQKRMAIAAQDNLTLDDVLEFFDTVDVDARTELYDQFCRFNELMYFARLLDENHSCHLLEDELESLGKTRELLITRSNEMFTVMKFDVV